MRKPEYLTKEQAVKRSGLSRRRLCDLAQRGLIRRTYAKDPENNRRIVVFAAQDIDRLKANRNAEIPDLPMLGSVATVAAMQQPSPNGGIPSGISLASNFEELLRVVLEHVETGKGAAPKQWLTLEEADAWIGLPAMYIGILIKKGKLPALDVGVRPGGRFRVCRRDLEALVGEIQASDDREVNAHQAIR